MAEDVTLLNVNRPQVDTFSSGELGGNEDADYLTIKLDRYSNGRTIVHHHLKFADYAGLETEWETGTATTVLDAAVASEMSEIDWPDETITGNQRAYVGATYDEAL